MNKEVIKEFLKPDWRKILVVIVVFLFLLQAILFAPGAPGQIWGGYVPLEETLVGFLIYLSLGYLFSCVLFFVFDKFRKKK